MEFQYHISEMTAETAAADFVKEFVQVEKFLLACQQCPNYNTRWTCPPFDFDPMTIWSGYTTLRLYARILHADGADQPLDGALAALKREKRLYREKLYRWEQAEPGSQMLLAGTCDQCDRCEKAQGRPCCHRGAGRRCGGLPASVFPHAHSVGPGRQSAGVSGAGRRPAGKVKKRTS